MEDDAVGVHPADGALILPEPPPPPPRSRRSALREPALVEPAVLAEDAEGRVAVFTVTLATVVGARVLPPQPGPVELPRRAAAGEALLRFLEGWGGRGAVAVVMVAAWAAGLLATR